MTLKVGLGATLSAVALFAPPSPVEAQTTRLDAGLTGKADAARAEHEGDGEDTALRTGGAA